MIKALVVDDSAYNRVTIARMLQSAPEIDVIGTAVNGEDAIKAYNRARFDLVLLDINLPGISGVETCRQLREMAREAGIVMVTVRGAEDDKVHALEAGADDFIGGQIDDDAAGFFVVAPLARRVAGSQGGDVTRNSIAQRRATSAVASGSSERARVCSQMA